MFTEADRDLILSIPISQGNHADKMIWSPEEKGIYSVKSGYRHLMGEFQNTHIICWSALWNLPIPPKVKIFVWQACLNILPTTDNLELKRVFVQTGCPLCHAQRETVSHLFFFLHGVFGKEWWRRVGNIRHLDNADFQDWLSLNLSSLNIQSASLSHCDVGYLEGEE